MSKVTQQNKTNEQQVTRRDYMKTVSFGALMMSLGAFFGVSHGWFFSKSKQQDKRLGSLGDIRSKHGEQLKINGKLAIIQVQENKVRVMSLVCTHMGCDVTDKTNDAKFEGSRTQYWCPCHNGHYTIDGEKIRGPQPRSLPFYEVYIDGDDVYTKLSATIEDHKQSWLVIPKQK